MKKDRRTGLNLVLVSVVCYLLLISVPIDSRAQETEEDTSFVPESLYDSMELLDNTNLEEPVSFEIQGDSGEFSHTQNLTAGSLTLNWTHVADAIRGAYHKNGAHRIKVSKDQILSINGYEAGVIAASIILE